MHNQQTADSSSSQPGSKWSSGAWRKPATGPLRHTTPQERDHRNRGIASSTAGWTQSIREDRD